MFGRRKKLTYHGCDHDKLEQALYTLCAIEDDVLLSDHELTAMNRAIEAVSCLMNAMNNGGKVKWDD